MGGQIHKHRLQKPRGTRTKELGVAQGVNAPDSVTMTQNFQVHLIFKCIQVTLTRHIADRTQETKAGFQQIEMWWVERLNGGSSSKSGQFL